MAMIINLYLFTCLSQESRVRNTDYDNGGGGGYDAWVQNVFSCIKRTKTVNEECDLAVML
jgi:hypothetical protein